MGVLFTATEYRNAGLSVHPLRLDGSKAPALPRWQPYCDRLPTDAELSEWFSQPAGIGLIAGSVSGGLEIFDFDDGELFVPWRSMVASIVDRLPVVETPSGGWHVLFRCDEICGNSKIAVDPQRDKKTLIETRGEHGYVVAEGSPIETHAAGLPYTQYSGPRLPTVPRINPGERRELWQAARSFDRSESAKSIVRKRERTKPLNSGGEHPAIAEFNCRMEWETILGPHGWTSRDGEHWTRPGKSFGVSARVVLAADGNEVLTVFSGNAGPLSPTTGSHRTWNKFRAWSALEFRGDIRSAFLAIVQEAVA